MAKLVKHGTRSALDVRAGERREEERRREADARAAQKPVERQAADERP